MTQPTQSRRRFAPVPIETTFKEHRRGGPAAEPTPEPSPTSARSPSPPLPLPLPVPAQVTHHETQTVTREKRRFAPQLLESSRRSRRAGDVGPATKPADKTDITPYAKHIYSLASKKKHNRRPGHARRESCDDMIADHVFDLNKLDAQRRLEEAMSAFPNSTVRLGGAEHFFLREGSEDDDDVPRGRGRARGAGDKNDSRRDSSEDNVNWMVKEMQKHAGQLAAERGEGGLASDLDDLESASARSDGPPDNTFAFTNNARHTMRGSTGPLSPIGELGGPLGSHPSRSAEPSYFGSATSYDAQAPPRTIGESTMPYVPSAPPSKTADVDMPDAPPARPAAAPASQIPPETGFLRTRGAFGRFYGYQNQVQDKAAEKELFRMRTRQSPPMAGKDLTFRMCPSPKQTKLDPEQKWDTALGGQVEPNRDATGQHGLWRGYCFTQNKGGEALAPSPRPAMIMTPMTPQTPYEHSDPYAATNGTLAPFPVSAEPTPVASGQASGLLTTSEHRSRAGEPKGLHMLMGLEQRLQKEVAAADLEERIASEFDDVFVTQVYNYLSLGYPATARVYDEELSKISQIPTEELEQEDDTVMDGIGSGAKGHLKISMDLDMKEDRRCPRWNALKKYIFEWARQHPDLDSITPLAWGVAQRRGSWGI
ncbi:hypothetical protein diail_5461 [Diaporthe ilicicola]|nr:hypothetical protein diail_5461 [Diaporthe ilicicola]